MGHKAAGIHSYFTTTRTIVAFTIITSVCIYKGEGGGGEGGGVRVGGGDRCRPVSQRDVLCISYH